MTPLVLLLTGMTALVLLALLLPLLHGWRAPAARQQFDRAVYRAQLDELGRDVARGVIGDPEAQAARVEIERRLLAAVASPQEISGPRPSRLGSSRALAIAAALIIAGGAGSVYLYLGAPGVPDIPFAERQGTPPPAQAAHVDMAAAAASLAAKLKTDPKNAEGWMLYGHTEAELGNWPIAADAYAHAIALGLNDADTLSGYGEMLVLGTDGIVGPPARAAFTSALQLDPKNAVSRYYIALADAQAGESQRAIDRWQGLVADLPQDSPMRAAIGRQIADAASAAGVTAPPLPPGQPAGAAASGTAAAGAATTDGLGLTQDQMAAAANMPPAQRDKMVRDMVAQLATRMAATPDDLNGWVRLGRAYAVIGDTDKAADAFDHAAKLKPGDVDIAMQEVQALLENRKPDDVIPVRAVALLKQIQATSPDQPEVLWYLGVVAARNGNRDEAKQDWQRLLPLLPPDGDDHKLVIEALQTLDK